MKAAVLNKLCDLSVIKEPLVYQELPVPKPGPGQILIKVKACGVCHTELDEIEGRAAPSRFPMVLGHEVVGVVAELGRGASRHVLGQRVGVGWIYSACGSCEYCRSGRENLCPRFKATGRDADGGYAEYMAVPENSAYIIPEHLSDTGAAPLLCAGGVGYRSLRLAQVKDGGNLGLTGFGASGHLVLKLVKHIHPGLKVFVFARSHEQRAFALELGAAWAGATEDRSPELCDAIIDTTPVWKPVACALLNLKAGGRLVINAIRKQDSDKNYLSKLNYGTHLWLEKEIKSVANVTRKDIEDFLKVAAKIKLEPKVTVYGLEQANRALWELKRGRAQGAKVLVM
ncbi:MAG: zinc-dependent alcohol dehydrogenase family protein [Spirochaetales bacterium]|nr:zinc-dependent alcohol dehydrogenase family protein [Spirochaetales bacterium]